MIRNLYIAFSLCLLYLPMFAQSPLQQRVDLRLGQTSLENALNTLVLDQNIRLIFDQSLIPAVTVYTDFKKRPVQEVLNQLLSGTAVTYRLDEQHIILERYQPPPSPSVYILSGVLKDAQSGERLIGALIVDSVSQNSAVTNEYGFFAMKLFQGQHQLGFSYLGYQAFGKTYFVKNNQTIEVSLNPSVVNIPLVVVTPKLQGVPLPGFGNYKIKGEEVSNLPALLGEPDLIRLLPLLPGVITGTDGVEGIHVRGGSPEQNLILIDDVPIYNVYHAAGVFSVFNSSAIRNAELIKGGFPARYGGRLSSVLNIRTKEGNDRKLSGEASIGMLTARLTLEGPIVKNKCAFFISGRQSFLNWYVKPLSTAYKKNKGEAGAIDYKFHDWNAKVHYKFSLKDAVYLSFYSGSDNFQNDGSLRDTLLFQGNNQDTLRYRADQAYGEGLSWGNTIGALRWNHVFGEKLFSNTVLTFSKLEVGLGYFTQDSVVNIRSGQTEYRSYAFGKFRSDIRDLGLKTDFEYATTPVQTLRFGLGATRRFFNPGILAYDDTQGPVGPATSLGNDPITTSEFNGYLENEWRLKAGRRINTGVYFADLMVQGKSYWSLQPRLSIFWPLSDYAFLRASAGKMTQYLHLLSSSGIGLPTDIWVPATEQIKPEHAWQTDLGLDLSFQNLFDFSIEGYYKKMTNLVSFTEGAFFLNNWEENVTIGKGRAYGMEFSLKKEAGRSFGWIAYSLSWADRQFEKIYFGRTFPYKYDRRHDLKLVGAYRVNHWLTLSANWVFSSGFAFSLPLEQYNVDLTDIIYPPQVRAVLAYGSKNQYRMPYYHRLDINAKAVFFTKNIKHQLQLGIYNVYDRKNPLYYDVRTRFVNENYALKAKKEFVQVWLLPFSPSVNYTVSF